MTAAQRSSMGEDTQPGSGHPAPRSAKARAAIVLLAILGPQVILYAPSLFGDKIALSVDLLCVPQRGDVNIALWDPVTNYEPYRQFVAAELHAGRVPLWNPLIYCGTPVFTNIWSPFQWLYYVRPDPSLLAWLGLLKSLVAGTGAYCFFRRVLRVGFWPATFGAAIYPLSFFLVFWHYYVLSNACVWLPWLLLCTDETVRRPGRWGLIGVALVTAATLVEVPWPHLLLASGLFLLWRIGDEYGWRVWRSPRALGAMLAMTCGWVAGGLLSMPQNLPAAQYLQTSRRVSARTEGLIEQPPAGLRAWEELLFPHHSGDMSTASVYLPGKGQGNQLEGAAAAYAGLLPLLVLAPFAFRERRLQRFNGFWVALGLFGFVYQLDVPFVSSLFRMHPFTVIRNNRFTFYTGWATVALAVTGLEALLTVAPRRSRWFGIAVAVLVVAAGDATLRLMDIPPALIERGRQEGYDLHAQAGWFHRVYLWEAALCAVALAAWYALRAWPRAQSTIGSTVAVLAVAELIASAWAVNPQADRDCYYPPTPFTEALRQAPSGRVSMGLHLRPSIGMMYGQHEIRGYDGADPLRIVRLFEAVTEWSHEATEHVVTMTFPAPPSPMLDMLGLRYVFHHAGVEPPPAAGAKVLVENRAGWLEVRDSAMPRVWVPRRFETVSDDARCLELMKREDFDPRQVAYVAREPSGTNSPLPADETEGTAAIVEDLSTRVVVSAQLQNPGLLVLSDAWDAGWKAFINGREVPVWRTNYLLRGVPLPAGESTVEFRYEPIAFTWGLRLFAASAVSLCLWAGACLRQRAPGGVRGCSDSSHGPGREGS